MHCASIVSHAWRARLAPAELTLVIRYCPVFKTVAWPDPFPNPNLIFQCNLTGYLAIGTVTGDRLNIQFVLFYYYYQIYLLSNLPVKHWKACTKSPIKPVWGAYLCGSSLLARINILIMPCMNYFACTWLLYLRLIDTAIVSHFSVGFEWLISLSNFFERAFSLALQNNRHYAILQSSHARSYNVQPK